MGMSMHVEGFKPPDDAWEKMAAVHRACTAAGVPVPPEVEKFFGWGTPSDFGAVVEESELRSSGAVRTWAHHIHPKEGFEIDLSKLDPSIKFLRIYCAR